MTLPLQTDKNREVLGGWGEIAAHLKQRIGMQVSPDTLRRWAKRAEDPLPVRRWACGKRPHVLVDASDLDEWIDRHWQQAAPCPQPQKARTDGNRSKR